MPTSMPGYPHIETDLRSVILTKFLPDLFFSEYFCAFEYSLSSERVGEPRISIIISPGLVPIHMPTICMSTFDLVHVAGSATWGLAGEPLGQKARIARVTPASAAVPDGRVYISMYA